MRRKYVATYVHSFNHRGVDVDDDARIVVGIPPIYTLDQLRALSIGSGLVAAVLLYMKQEDISI